MRSMDTTGDDRYEAEVRWTTHGVAHIRAEDWGSLGFGQGWACARDHLPTIADQVVKVRSERARFHGPGPEGRHVAADLGYLALGVAERAPQLRDQQGPLIRELVLGYVAGINAQMTEALAAGSLPEWCADAAWIRPIQELDYYAYMADIALLASGRNLVGVLGRAEPPGPDGPLPPSPMSALGGAGASEAAPGASNGWAFGRDATASGHGIVVANPHFPWGGEARFWECHLTIPGTVDVYGAALVGTPGVQLGCNRDVAWAHTVSRGSRFTLARLDLVPGQPTRYRFGDEEREMTSRTFEVQVQAPAGNLETVQRTLWRSHHGPMVNLPLLGWGNEVGFTYRDANLDNAAIFEQFLAMDQARSLHDFQQTFESVQGLPWVNTLAADRDGRAWYIDASPTPNLSVEAQHRFIDRVNNDMVGSLLYDARVSLLDGSDPADEWVNEAASSRPGLVPFQRLPQQERTDYVANANDPFWLTNPAAPIEGHSPLHGIERTAPSLRTRQNHRVAGRLAATGQVTTAAALEAMLDNTSLSAQLLVDAVIARCRAAGDTDLVAAAAVLESWDRRFNLDSRGAVLWREIVAGFPPKELRDAGGLFDEPFDPDSPIETPRGLAPPRGPDGHDQVLAAVRRALLGLQSAAIDPDAALGQVQWADRGDRRVPVHGGGEGDGVCNILAPLGALATTSIEPGPAQLDPVPGHTDRTGLAVGGYRCTYGTSFLMSVELTDHGPEGVALLAYGQSGDPRSPHHVDGTESYARREARPILFTDAAIEADPQLKRATVTGIRPTPLDR